MVYIRSLSSVCQTVRQTDRQTFSWWIHCWKLNYMTGFAKSLSTCSILARSAMWHSTILGAKFPNLLLFQCATRLINRLPHRHFLPRFSPHHDRLQAVGSSPWGARPGRCGAASDQSELELCVTCKGEAPERDNSWVFKVRLFPLEGRGIDDKESEARREKSRLLLLAL